MSDRRDQQLHFRVSKPELERIRNKMESSGILSIGSYLRKMALDGYCLYLDLPQLRRMAYLLQMCSNNLNQYTKAANENGRVYAAVWRTCAPGWMNSSASASRYFPGWQNFKIFPRSWRTAGVHMG